MNQPTEPNSNTTSNSIPSTSFLSATPNSPPLSSSSSSSSTTYSPLSSISDSSAFFPPVLKCTRCKQILKAFSSPIEEGADQLSQFFSKPIFLPSGSSSSFSSTFTTFPLKNESLQGEKSIHIPSSCTSESYIFIPPTSTMSSVTSAPSWTAPTSVSLPRSTASRPQFMEPNQISSHLSILQKMYEALNCTMDLTLPLCLDCTSMMRDQMKKELLSLKEDQQSYHQFLHSPSSSFTGMNSTTLPSSPSKELQALQKEELLLLQSIEELIQQSNHVQHQTLELEKESEQLDAQENVFWEQYHALHQELNQFQMERHTFTTLYHLSSKQTEKLKKTNVYNDIFRIWHEGPFGTINGFRLGRLANQPVEWPEINAGWGQATLLLDILSRKLDFEFVGYRLHPLGSFSKIEKLHLPTSHLSPTNTTSSSTTAATMNSISTTTTKSSFTSPRHSSSTLYDLYGQGEFPFVGRLFFHRKFDHGMVCFLHCVQQLGDHCENLDDQFRLPYRIYKDTIADLSIRLHFNQDEVWTRACKYMLTNLKWILAFVTKRAGSSSNHHHPNNNKGTTHETSSSSSSLSS